MLLICICCAWIVGIWLGSLFDISAAFILAAILPIPLIIIYKNKRKYLILLTLVLFSFFSGAWLSPNLSHQSNSIEYYNHSGEIAFVGFIEEPPENKDLRSRIIISIREINGQRAFGKVIYDSFLKSNLKYGDIISGLITLKQPPTFDDFNYRNYLRGEGIYSIAEKIDYKIIASNTGSRIMAWIFELRENLAESLASALPEPQASLCQGVVLGVRNNISQDLKSDLSSSGTTHLLAISGLNLTIIAGLFLSIGLLFFGRRYYIYAWLTLIIIWFYSFLTGLQAPVIRSAIMASIFLIAEILGRQKNAFPALIISAAIMTTFSPQILMNLSFQLSFLAMIGLIYITPFFKAIGQKAIYAGFGEDGFWTKPLLSFTDSFSVSLGAVIAVWPISAYTFGIISFAGPVATFFISPALAPIIILGSFTAFIGLFNPAIAQVIGWVAWLFLTYMIVVAGIFAALPLSYSNKSPLRSSFLWLYYVSLITLINRKFLINISSWMKARFNVTAFLDSTGNIISKKAKYIMPSLIIISVLTSAACLNLPENNLKISFLNVGEGDSILIQSNGQNILVDGGPSGQKVSQELGKLLPFWERDIDLIILSHPHLDHLAGLLEAIKRYRVGRVLTPPFSSDVSAYQELMQLIKEKNIRYGIAEAGQKLILNNKAILEVLNPSDNIDNLTFSDPDENSMVLRLTYGQRSVVLTGDIGIQTESLLTHERLIKKSDILKIPHHGSEFSSSMSFLKTVSPSIAIISAGADNRFGHPDSDVISRIAESGINILYRTDVNGTITLILDDKSSIIKVKKEK